MGNQYKIGNDIPKNGNYQMIVPKFGNSETESMTLMVLAVVPEIGMLVLTGGLKRLLLWGSNGILPTSVATADESVEIRETDLVSELNAGFALVSFTTRKSTSLIVMKWLSYVSEEGLMTVA